MYSPSVQCEFKSLLLYADDSTIVAPLWKGSRAKSRSFVWKISPHGWTEISSNVTQKSLKKLIIKKRGNSTFYPFACDDCQKCLHLQREVRTSVIARQKFDYIFYRILRFNISYGSISVSGASDTQFIALRQLRLRSVSFKGYEATKNTNTAIGGQLSASHNETTIYIQERMICKGCHWLRKHIRNVERTIPA